MKMENAIGEIHNKLAVVGYHGVVGKNSMWLCRCECGNEVVRALSDIRRGRSSSCGSAGCRKKSGIKPKEIIGDVFTLLTVLRMFDRMNDHERYECQCQCGNIVIAYKNHLLGGTTRSCGCLNDRGKHGHYSFGVASKLITSWNTVIQRSKKYSIPIDDRWMKLECFESDIGDTPSTEHRLIMIDKSIGYVPGNMKWVQTKSQTGTEVGDTVGKYTIIGDGGRSKRGQKLLKVMCQCGQIKLVCEYDLKRKRAKGCMSCTNKPNQSPF